MTHTDVVVSLVNDHKWEVGVELGVLYGRTLFAILDRCPTIRILLGVDLWQTYSDRDEPGFHHYRNHDMDAYHEAVRERAKEYDGRCQILRMDTSEAAELVEDGSLDFVFIDADHTASAVRRDIQTWTPKLKPEGWLVGDDTHFRSVRTTINELLPGWIPLPDHVWAIPGRKVSL